MASLSVLRGRLKLTPTRPSAGSLGEGFNTDNRPGTVLSANSIVLSAGGTHEETLTAATGGFYSYEIDTKGVGASIAVEIERKLMIDLLPFPIGMLLLAMGLYQRAASPSSDDVLDAVLDD